MSVPCLLIAALGLLGAPAGARADFFGPQTNGVEIGFVTVGQPGNAIDRAGRRGAVPVEYRISVTEVATRTVVRASELGGLRIEPVSFAPDAAAGGISWNQAARFVNWLNVDAGFSPAYKFEFQPGHPRYTPHDDAQPWEPGDVGYDPGNPQRNSRAMYVLPTEDEWYKAAYHDPVTGGYFRFPTGSDSLPEAVRSGDAAGTAVFLGSGASETAPVTMAGGMSPHGTMGQGGNAWEWVETPEDGPWAPAGGRRIMRGGGFVSTSRDLGPDGYATLPAGNRDLTFGFRVASRIRVVDANARLEGLGLSAGVLKPVHGTTESLPAVSAEFPDVALMWHEFFSCSSDSYQNAQMDSRPDFFPFESPLPGARRINQRVTTALAGALDGGGTWRTSSLGVFTPAFGSQFGTYSIETTPSGRDLPSSAGSGRLGGDLVLPDGRVIPAGARLYLDLQGHRLDPSQPSQLWHDAATGLTTQVYAGGVLDLYYRDAAGRAEAGLPGGYRALARYTNSSVTGINHYVANTNRYLWNGVAFPGFGGGPIAAEVDISSAAALAVNFAVVEAERNTSPYLGFFFGQRRAFNVRLLQGREPAMEGFHAATHGYEVLLPWEPSRFRLRPKAAGLGADVKVDGVRVPAGSDGPEVELEVGSRVMRVEVTSGDGSAGSTYVVTVTRQPLFARGADLSGRDLRGADLRHAELAGANLSGADLAGAWIEDADLAGAILDGVRSGGLRGVPRSLPDGWRLESGVLVRLDRIAPVIRLLGPPELAVYEGGVFADPGASVTDDVDPSRVIKADDVPDLSREGVQRIGYRAADAAGNVAVAVERVVRVLAAPRLVASALDLAGANHAGGDVSLASFTGMPGNVARSPGGEWVARQGGMSMALQSAGHGVASFKPVLKEGGSQPVEDTRSPLHGFEVFDDGTFEPVAVSWTPMTNDVVVVTADGWVRALEVARDSTGEFEGRIGGVVHRGGVLVTNSLPDNAGPLAGDGFDDAWQQSVGITTALDPNALREGVPYWQLYAMGINPTAPVAGPLVTAKVEDDGHPSVTFTWNPAARGYSFVVQQATDLDGGFVDLAAPPWVVVQRADGLWQVTVRGPVPVEGVDHQFLRVQILRP